MGSSESRQLTNDRRKYADFLNHTNPDSIVMQSSYKKWQTEVSAFANFGTARTDEEIQNPIRNMVGSIFNASVLKYRLQLSISILS
jgi:hypothetical protein